MPSIELNKKQQNALACDQFVTQCVHGLLFRLGVRSEGLRWKFIQNGHIGWMDSAPFNSWQEIDPYIIMPCSGLMPIKRDEFPIDFWNYVVPSEGSILWRIMQVYNAGHEFNQPAKDERINNIIDYRFAWIALSLTSYWWNDRGVGMGMIMPWLKQSGSALKWLIENGVEDERIINFFEETSEYKLSKNVIIEARRRLGVASSANEIEEKNDNSESQPKARPWTQQEIDTAVTLRNNGESYSDIGKMLNRTKNAVKNQLEAQEEKSSAHLRTPRTGAEK